MLVFTADHAHGFDVYGSVNQEYVGNHRKDADMRSAVGLYEYSGWPGYKDEDGDGFPDNFVRVCKSHFWHLLTNAMCRM